MCSQSRASLVQVMAVTLPAMTSLENSLSTVMGHLEAHADHSQWAPLASRKDQLPSLGDLGCPYQSY